jgi:hypothetical protein
MTADEVGVMRVLVGMGVVERDGGGRGAGGGGGGGGCGYVNAVDDEYGRTSLYWAAVEAALKLLRCWLGVVRM